MSLRRWFLYASLLLVAVALVATSAMVWSTGRLAGATSAILDNLEAVEAANAVAIGLHRHRRHELLFDLASDPNQLDDADVARSEVERALQRSQQFADEPQEQVIFAQVRSALGAYFAAVDRRRGGQGSEHDVAEAFLRAEDTLENLTELNTGMAQTEHAQAQALDRRIFGLGIAMALLALGGIALFIASMRRRLVEPVQRLAGAIATSSGEPLRLGLGGELGDVERAFDRMGRELARQRIARLEFMAAVAHDLRTPLTSLRGYASLVRDGKPLPPEATLRKAFEVFARQVLRLDRQIGDLLDATRIQAGHFELRREAADVAVLARDVVALFEHVSDAHQLRLVTRERLVASVDATRLFQVLTNLVSNAIKYSPAGGEVAVTVEGRGRDLVLTVRDQGMGIAHEEKERIFEAFHRGHGSRDDIPGLGLGLAASRRIVEGHGGRVEVESEPGRGATFRVVLPDAVLEAVDRPSVH